MNISGRRITKAAVLAVFAGSVLVGCTPVGHGVPMGGRDYDGKPPYNQACDPNGVKLFQPDTCK